MAMQKLPGSGVCLPTVPQNRLFAFPPAFSTNPLIDADGEKVAIIGRVWNKDGAAKTLVDVGFRWGAVTKGADTDVTLSIQDVLTTGPDVDETQDQSVDVGTANIVANTWLEVTLGVSRAVAYGALLGVVWEYKKFNTSDSIVIAGISLSSTTWNTVQCYTRLKTGTWASINSCPNLVLVFSDGTYGTLEGAGIFSTIQAIVTYNIDTGAQDEVALKFRVPFPITIDGCWMNVDSDGDFTAILYDDSGPITDASRAMDKDNRPHTNQSIHWLPFAAPVTLAANTNYYLSARPDSVTSISAYYFDVNAANYLQAWDAGMDFNYTSRVDGGAWAAPTTTRRPWFGLTVIGFDDGAGGGGAGISRGRVQGGM